MRLGVAVRMAVREGGISVHILEIVKPAPIGTKLTNESAASISPGLRKFTEVFKLSEV
jgi:hypothetical protein